MFTFYFLLNDAKPSLWDCRFDEYSQSGDDGIIAKIFEIIGTKSKLCVEFGANDGFTGSNTARLWTRCGWRGVLIETDANYFKKLLEKTNSYKDHLIRLKRHVGDGVNSIDSILTELGISEVDFMSIDVDGNDYYIANSIERIKPRVVECEYNPTMPSEVDIHQSKNDFLGCSVAALNRIFSVKGYSLVALTDINAFFVLSNEAKKIEENFETDLRRIKFDKYVCYLITTYDSKPFLLHNGSKFPYAFNQNDAFNQNAKFKNTLNISGPQKLYYIDKLILKKK